LLRGRSRSDHCRRTPPPRIGPGFDPSSEETRTVLIATRPPEIRLLSEGVLIATRPLKIRPSSEDAPPPRRRPGFDPSSEKTRTVLIATRPPEVRLLSEGVLIATRPLKIRPSSEDASPPKDRAGIRPIVGTDPHRPDCYEAVRDPNIVGERLAEQWTQRFS